MTRVSVAVVGHVEWVTFARVPRTPRPGEIVHAEDVFDVPAGGGPVAAVQLAKLAGTCQFFTALGADDLGARAARELVELGLDVHAAARPQAQRRAFTHVDAATAERTITVMGSRIGPHGDDALPWARLDDVDAAYFCAGDDEALRQARRARVLVVTAREAERLRRVRIYADAVVGSAVDPDEEPGELDPAPGLIVRTRGAGGGEAVTRAGREVFVAPDPPGPVVCAYGAGDSFAAGLTYGLGAGLGIAGAIGLAARCGAACITGRGPYEAQLVAGTAGAP